MLENDLMSYRAAKNISIADKILKRAIGELEDVIIIGTHKDGTEYFVSSIADGPNVNWMLDRAKKALLEVIDKA